MDLTRVLLAYITSSLGANQPAHLQWQYDSVDPLAIRMRVDSERSWSFGRDLVAEALVSPDTRLYGEGDVQVQSDGAWVRVYLTSPEGTAQIRMIKQDLINFIDDTIRIVGPEADETKIIQKELDEILPKILDQAKGA